VACCALAFDVAIKDVGAPNTTAVAASQNNLRREIVCDLICSLMMIPLAYIPLVEQLRPPNE